jgi:hypothetical protein
MGHSERRPAHEREWGRRHACVADLSKIGLPVFRLRLQEIDWIRPLRRWRPLCVAASGRSLTRRAPTLAALLIR